VTSDRGAEEIGGAQRGPTAHPRAAVSTHLLTSSGARAKKTAAATETVAGEETGALVLRSGVAPVGQLDFDDRHDTRATASDDLARRYQALRADRRRDEWHRLATGVIAFAALVALYLAGFIVLSRVLPYLDPWLAAKIVGLAFVAAGGGVAIRSAGHVLKRRSVRPQRRDRND
jgi:hypothetical protein